MEHILSAKELSLAAFAANLASQHSLDITKIYCRKTGKLVGHRTIEEIELLENLYASCKLDALTTHLNLCDSVSPAFVKIQTETLNKLEDLDPVSLFCYYINLLTRQFNRSINVKMIDGNPRHVHDYISVEHEHRFKNSLVLAHKFVTEFVGPNAKLVDTSHYHYADNPNINLEKLKDCNKKLRWLLTLNLHKQRFYLIDVTNALDNVSIVEKRSILKEVDYLKRNPLSQTIEHRTRKDAEKLAQQSGKIVEFIDPGMGAAFYDRKTNAVYDEVENIPDIVDVKLRDFLIDPVLPHELATSKGIDWVINYFPKAFEKCKSHMAKNKMLGFHETTAINSVFTRGTKTDEISNEFAEYLRGIASIVSAKRTDRQIRNAKYALNRGDTTKPLDVAGLANAVEMFSNAPISEQKSLTFVLAPAKVPDGPMTFEFGVKKD